MEPNIEDQNWLEDYFVRISDERNELVHHLLSIPGFDLETHDGRVKVINYLDEKFQNTSLMMDFLKSISKHIENLLEKAEIDEFGKLKNSINCSSSDLI